MHSPHKSCFSASYCLLPVRRKTAIAGFTLIEVLIAVVIVGILAAFMLSAVNSSLRSSREVQSMQNMKSIGLALLQYAADHNGKFPSLMERGQYVWSWDLQIFPYLDFKEGYSGTPASPVIEAGLPLDVFRCPLDQRKADVGTAFYPRSYGMPGVAVNMPGGDYSGGIAGREIGEGIRQSQISKPGHYVMLCRMPRGVETPGNTVGRIGNCLTNGPNPVTPNTVDSKKDWAIFRGKTPYVFGDGRISLLTPEDAEPVWPYRWRVDH